MAGDAYFRINACYKKEDFEKAKKESDDVVESVESVVKKYVSEKHGWENPTIFQDYQSVKWHGMLEDMMAISLLFPDLVIVIEKQLNDTSLFDDDGDTFTKYAFWNGQYSKCKGVVTYSENYKFK